MGQDRFNVQPRVTRSKKALSPYAHVGVITATTSFKIEDALNDIEGFRLEKEALGMDEFEEYAVPGPIPVFSKRPSSEEPTGLPAQKKARPANEESADEGHPCTTFSSKPTCSDTAACSDTGVCPDAGAPFDAGTPLKARHPKALKRQRRKEIWERPKRKAQRELARQESGVPFKGVAIRKGMQSLREEKVKTITLPADAVKVVSTGFTGARRGKRGRETASLEEVKGRGLKDAGWDGTDVCLLATEDGTCVGILYPSGEDDPVVKEQAEQGTEALDAILKTAKLSFKELNNDRGNSPALARGVSHGGGQEQPTMRRHSKSTDTALDNLVSMPVFQRYAGVANHSLRFYAPEAYKLQKERLDELFNRNGHLQRNFNDTVFAACTWNLGPQFASYEHVDSNNYPFTWCAVTAMGTFNPDCGGHLVLWDLGIYVRFPPGATILIPSALLVHSNVCVREGETRYSFVQYTAGAVLRWVANDFQPQDRWYATATEEMKAKRELENRERVARGLSTFSKVAELRAQYSTEAETNL
ncbi:hypothetical protein PQX77_018951 [Marasmius sp. AFHP31]|nr:hypothetical protein PQX77_018951 [Marasmius sp. AFHP31]